MRNQPNPLNREEGILPHVYDGLIRENTPSPSHTGLYRRRILSSELLAHTVLLRSDSDSDERPFSNRHSSNGTVVGVVRVEWPNGDLSLL